jgi:protoporphyrinogen oxidase
MNNKSHKVYIVGAGISGLVAAKVLEENGFSPTIIEGTSKVGGRVKTDIVKGYQLDKGFQVLLTAYPAAQKYFDLEKLQLQKIKPGAVIFKKSKRSIIGDPLRDISLLLPTLFSGVGNLSDKLKVLKLNRLLKRKKISDIFDNEEQTTLSYLSNFGFSSKMINQFFKPFFAGIFLEPNLDTSSRMFEFVYKMFGEGFASLPKGGIQEIPNQLAQSLSKTTFLFNSKVKSIKDGELELENGEVLINDFTIVATEASKLISNLKGQSIKWKSCDTLYFETPKRTIDKPLIGLISNSEALINNIFYHTSLNTKTKGQKELISVTIVKNHDLPETELINKVKDELKKYCAISSCEFLKRYLIPMALPNLSNIQYDIAPSETQLTSSIFLSGDVQLNGSLNAAILSGEKAAFGVINTSGGF